MSYPEKKISEGSLKNSGMSVWKRHMYARKYLHVLHIGLKKFHPDFE